MVDTLFRLGVFATHPIQYHVPLWKKLAQDTGLDVKVYYASDFSVRGEVDPDFGVPVSWDTPLLQGYTYQFMDNVSRKPLPAHGGFLSVNCPQVRRVFVHNHFDAVLVHGYAHLFEWQVFRGAWRKKTPILLRGDNREGTGVKKASLFEWARSTLLRHLYRRVAVGLAVGAYMHRHFMNHGMPPEKIVDCPHCVDTDEMARQESTLPSRADIRQIMGIPKHAFVLIISGKLIARKDHMTLAKALARVNDNGRVWVIVLGDGPLRRQVQDGFRAAIGSRALFPGFVNQGDIGRYYAAADALVMTSLSESWGLVANEAMFYGLPAIVTTKCGCHEDLVLPGKTGLVFPAGNAPALAQAINAMAGHPDRARRMGAAARQHIARYSADEATAGIVRGLGVVGWDQSKACITQKGEILKQGTAHS